jgi:hypothetical protein
MSLKPEQTAWLSKFTALEAAQNSFDQEMALKKSILADVRKQLAGQKETLRKAMTFDVVIDGKDVGKMLEDKGTQLDEVDFDQIKAGAMTLSKERVALIGKSTAVIATLNEKMKKATVERGGERVALFEPDEIAAELWTPLVRERLLPETLVANINSDTQKMLDQTNALYAARIAEKEKAGELGEATDMVSAGLGMGSKMASIAGNLAGALGGPGSGLAKDVLGLCSAALDSSDAVYKAVKDSGFPDALGTLADNVGTILEKVVALATKDKDLAKVIASGYKAAASLTKAGLAFKKGSDGAAEGLNALAEAFGSAFAAGDPKGENKQLKEASILIVASFKQLGAGVNIGQKLAAGDTKGVIDGLTEAAKNAVSAGLQFKAEEDKSRTKDKDKQKKIDKNEADAEKSIGEIIDWSGAGLKTVASVVDQARQGKIADSVETMLTDIGKTLGEVLVSKEVPKETADVITSAYASAVQAEKVIAALIQKPPKKQEALTALGEGIAKTFEAAAPDNKALQKAGASLSLVFAAGAKAIDIKKAYDEDKYDEVAKAIAEQAGAAAKTLFAQFGAKDDKPEGEKDKDKDKAKDKGKGDAEKDERVEAIKTALDDVASLGKGLEALKKLSALDIAVNIKDKQVADAVNKLEAEKSEMAATLELLRTGGDAGRAAAMASSIDALIAKMAKDRMIIDMAFKVSQAGASAAAKFVPALGAADAAIALVANILAAANRAMELNKWMQNKKDFAAAQSVMTSASQKFVTTQRDQFSHYAIQAAVEAARLIAEVGKLSGMAAPIAAAVSASASAAGELEKVIKQFYDAKVLEDAWKTTSAAFANPNNRKLGLQARAQNPTLSKYTIAWGAVEKNDPLAKNAMASCGLNETTLANEDSSVDKVVKYLELYFRDDDQLYRKLADSADWLPPEIELTVQSWSTVKARAVTSIALANPDTPRLDGLLTKLSAMSRKASVPSDELADKLDTAGLTVLVALLDDLRSELAAYQPQSDNAKGREAMQSALKLLLGKADGALGQARSRRAQLVEEAKKKAA